MSGAQDTNVSDLVVDNLIKGQTDGLRRLFNENGLRAPEIILSPKGSELHSPMHRQFATKCKEIADAEGRVQESQFSLSHFGGLSDWIMMIDVENNGDDFRYSHYGPAIAESSGKDMFGKRTSDFDGHVAVFFRSVYRAVLQLRDWVYSHHESPRAVFVRGWQRLIVPIYAEDGTITSMVALNIPDNEMSVGLELIIDPVFVVDQNQKVLFSNRAAKTTFGIPLVLPQDRTLEMLAGIDLNVSECPEELLSQNRIIDRVELVPNGSIMERLVMTVSAAEHRGQAFYVVVMRMIGT